MRKVILGLFVFFLLTNNLLADNPSKYNADVDSILDICGPKISDEYVPDLMLMQQYKEGNICLEKQIKKIAKNVFNEENYQFFCNYLTQTSSLYLKMITLLNEKSEGVDGLPGTYEQMQIYSQLHDFLAKILEIVVNYDTLHRK